MPKLVILWSDVIVVLLVLALAVYGVHVRRSANLRSTWTTVFRDPPALCSAVILVLFFGVALLDSLHFRRALAPTAGAASATAYGTRTESVLDVLLARQIEGRETSYSAPLATRGFAKDSLEVAGRSEREYPRLTFGGAHLRDDAREWATDVAQRSVAGLAAGLLAAAAVGIAVALALARVHRVSLAEATRRLARNQTGLPLRAALVTVLVLCVLFGPAFVLAQHYHVFGTDRTGNDVFYQALKSIRTAFVIGTLSTLATLPFAVAFGILAGYLRGWVDEVIQYLYTTLSSVPNVLLIAACVLMMQVFIDTHPELFETGAERADVRLFLLCVILGVTGWATLCRLLRAETMKLRELDYVQAATAFGVGDARIMLRHIYPNVVHLIIITTVLDFSALILYEAVLSYIGVGVDPSMNSFGGMINLARNEMSRDPLIWWSFVAAFGFMVALVLAANLFADGVRDAFDPRARLFRARRLPFARAAR
ncbi:MAG TPA: ABC transporter permease [Albitalea sp.]|uniref:ABC transporter permease n=1 Tax=Piscinibacter sp. TaxID=1903157 RepID=UPI002ED1BBA2